ncbi:MAG: DUF3800 domain-containing protein [Pseudolabrys sp.]
MEASPIGRLALSLYPLDPGARPFMILSGYYDESGTHGGSPITVLAGFLGPVEQWGNFEREWRKMLRNHGVQYVRAKELFHKQKQFKGWSDRQVRLLWAEMLYVLQEQKDIFASKTVVLEEDYRIFYVSDGPAKRERLDTKYALCLRTLLNTHPAIHRGFYLSGSINFVLEDGHKNAGDALRVFKEIREDPNFPVRDAIGFMSFGSKRDVPGLQAADALAYSVYRAEMRNLVDPINPYFEVSELEEELDKMGKEIIGCAASPECLTDLRQNFLRKKKKPMAPHWFLGPTYIVDPTSQFWWDHQKEPS